MSKLFLKNPQHLTTKKSLREELKTEWVLPRETIDSELLHHFILYWKQKHFTDLFDTLTATIFYENRTYNVHLHRCSLSDIILAEHNIQLALSFRVPLAKTGVNPIVLVSCNRADLNHGAHRVHNHNRSGKVCNTPHIKVKKEH